MTAIDDESGVTVGYGLHLGVAPPPQGFHSPSWTGIGRSARFIVRVLKSDRARTRIPERVTLRIERFKVLRSEYLPRLFILGPDPRKRIFF